MFGGSFNSLKRSFHFCFLNFISYYSSCYFSSMFRPCNWCNLAACCSEQVLYILHEEFIFSSFSQKECTGISLTMVLPVADLRYLLLYKWKKLVASTLRDPHLLGGRALMHLSFR